MPAWDSAQTWKVESRFPLCSIMDSLPSDRPLSKGPLLGPMIQEATLALAPSPRCGIGQRCASVARKGHPYPCPVRHIAPPGPERHPNPECQEQVGVDPLLAPRRIAAGQRSDQAREIRREAWPSRAGPPAPEEAEGLPVPAEQGGRLDERHDLPPGKAPGQQDQREAQRVRRASRLHVTLAVERQVLAEEEVLGGEGRPGPETHPRKPLKIDPEGSADAVQVNARLESFYDGMSSPASRWNSPQYLRC